MSKESGISPWVRPAMLGWAAFMAFGVALLAGSIDLFVPGAGTRFGRSVMEIMGMTPSWLADVIQLMFAVYAVGKSGERMMATWKGQAPPPREDTEQEP